MSFESRLCDVNPRFASVIPLQWVARCRNSAASVGSAVIALSVGRIRPGAENCGPASRLAPPLDPDVLWRWSCKAASWLLRLTIESLAQYGNAMYPELYHPEEHGNGHVQTMKPPREALPYGQHEDDLNHAPCKGDPADRRTGNAARLVKFWARWRHEAEARRQAALLSSFNDHLLRDIGVARDQLDMYTHIDLPAFGHHDRSLVDCVAHPVYAARP
jgi:uncharacterized protein YjiS (DUF1127 family)